jgi:hypothetical protein
MPASFAALRVQQGDVPAELLRGSGGSVGDARVGLRGELKADDADIECMRCRQSGQQHECA